MSYYTCSCTVNSPYGGDLTVQTGISHKHNLLPSSYPDTSLISRSVSKKSKDRQLCVCLLQRIKITLGGEEVEGVGVMKDEEVKTQEIEVQFLQFPESLTQT